jgi:hypothetical protein
MKGERRDESVQFSLHELMKLEDERILRERRDREADEAAALAAKQDATRREREAHERAEAQARERERMLRVEEEARREAMSRAAIEQARIEVEARTRADEAERERRHELELARLRLDVGKPHGPAMLLGSAAGGAAVAFIACVALYFGSLRPEAARKIEGLEAATQRAEARATQLGIESLSQGKQLNELKESLAVARADIIKLRDSATAKVSTPPHGAGGVPKAGGRPGQPPPPASLSDKCAGSRDPLCGLDLRGK